MPREHTVCYAIKPDCLQLPLYDQYNLFITV